MTKTRTYLLGAASVIPPITLPVCFVWLFFALVPDPVKPGPPDAAVDANTQAAVFLCTVALPATFLVSALILAAVGLFF